MAPFVSKYSVLCWNNVAYIVKYRLVIHCVFNTIENNTYMWVLFVYPSTKASQYDVWAVNVYAMLFEGTRKWGLKPIGL